ncbi:MAG TPA: hypothetical protein VF221_14280 [Chloroflexota bacterium]
MHCRITVDGHLDPTWSEWFAGMTITNIENGKAVLAGTIVDQAALHGVLAKIRDLGLPLTEVQCKDSR